MLQYSDSPFHWAWWPFIPGTWHLPGNAGTHWIPVLQRAWAGSTPEIAATALSSAASMLLAGLCAETILTWIVGLTGGLQDKLASPIISRSPVGMRRSRRARSVRLPPPA